MQQQQQHANDDNDGRGGVDGGGGGVELDERYYDAVAPTMEQNHIIEEGRSSAIAGAATNSGNSGIINNTTTTTTTIIDAHTMLARLDQYLQREKFVYRSRHRVFLVITIIFIILWFAGIPVAIALTENWTYQAAWYYSIQAGFGVGFGAITVKTPGMEILITIHLVLGALTVSFCVAYLVERYIHHRERSHTQEQTKRSRVALEDHITAEELGQEPLGWYSWSLGVVGLLFVFAAGILYGMLRENWTFTESLYFIVSSCQTSGLLAPPIRPFDQSQIFTPLFVALLVILGVPLWAYCIGKFALILVGLDRQQKKHITVQERLVTAQNTFVKQTAPLYDLDLSPPPPASSGAGLGASYQTRSLRPNALLMDKHGNDLCVDAFGAVLLWLLFSNKVNERELALFKQDFDSLASTLGSMGTGDDDKGDTGDTADADDEPNNNNNNNKPKEVVPLWVMNVRVRFLQLVQLGVLERKDWIVFCQQIRDDQDHSYDLLLTELSAQSAAEESEKNE